MNEDERQWDDLEDVEEYIPAAVRKQIPLEDFAWPEKRKYPITSQAHLDAAAKLIGRAPEAMQAKIKARAIAIAKRKGFKLPDSWAAEEDGKDGSDGEGKDGKAKESLDTPQGWGQAATFTPRPRIARMQVRFLHDGAVSKNGRIYPKETVARLVRSAKETLSTTNAPILTTFTSHAAADMDDVGSLAGKISDAYQEGENAFAWLDIPDTSKGRDMVALAQGGYLHNVSIRARNAQLAMEKGYSLPVVRGDVQLEGIDFTTRPGVDSAAIQSVVLEHEGETRQLERLTDTFDLDVTGVVLEMDEQPVSGQLAEAELLASPAPPVVNVQLDGKRVAEAITQAMSAHLQKGASAFTATTAAQPATTSMTTEVLTLQESLPLIKHHLQEAHGHLHDLCMPGKEAGRAISAANEQKIGAAHDAVAMALGIECRYDPDRDGVFDPDGDGDDDSSSDPDKNPDYAQDKAQGMYDDGDDPNEGYTGDGESAKENPEMPLTREEALKFLEDEGLDTSTLKPKKSKEEQLREELQAGFEAKLAEAQAAHQKQLDEIKALLSQTQTQAQQGREPGRQTMVETNPNATAGAGTGGQPRRQNEITRLLREEMHPDNWAQIADLTVPLDKKISPKWGLHIMSQILSGMIELHNYRATQSPLQI